jgi:hypothetical protein
MRFSWPTSDADSTVYSLASNDTFQACDFTGATQITDGGVLPSGENFVDYVFEDDSIDKKFYFASQIGCEQGQKVAVAVTEPYADTFDDAYLDGQRTTRIRACDCDHEIEDTMHSGGEAAHTGFVEGCKLEMPDDLSCCPSDVAMSNAGRDYAYGSPHYDDGHCIRKSDHDGMLANARKVYKKCHSPDAADKEKCDQYLIGACPYWRVYILAGYAYNSLVEGTPDCMCDGDDFKEGSGKPYCRAIDRFAGPRAPEYGPYGSYMPKGTEYSAESCSVCAGHGGQSRQYNGRGNNMPNKPENYGCDGANSTYDELCDMWYEYVHCKDLADGKTVGAGLTSDQTEPTLQEMLDLEITEERCAKSQRVAAMKMYLKSPECLSDGVAGCVTPAPTPAPTALPTNDPTPAPTPPPTPKPEEVDVSECRLEAMAALTLWLISALQ